MRLLRFVPRQAQPGVLKANAPAQPGAGKPEAGTPAPAPSRPRPEEDKPEKPEPEAERQPPEKPEPPKERETPEEREERRFQCQLLVGGINHIPTNIAKMEADLKAEEQHLVDLHRRKEASILTRIESGVEGAATGAKRLLEEYLRWRTKPIGGSGQRSQATPGAGGPVLAAAPRMGKGGKPSQPPRPPRPPRDGDGDGVPPEDRPKDPKPPRVPDTSTSDRVKDGIDIGTNIDEARRAQLEELDLDEQIKISRFRIKELNRIIEIRKQDRINAIAQAHKEKCGDFYEIPT